MNGNIYLAEDLTVQVGGAVPYDPVKFQAEDIDTKAPVSPIRASFKQYQCREISEIMQNRGYNCEIYDRAKASGICIKNTFGDWQCSVSSFDLESVIVNG